MPHLESREKARSATSISWHSYGFDQDELITSGKEVIFSSTLVS